MTADQVLVRFRELAHALDVHSKVMRRDVGLTAPQRLVLRLVGAHNNASASQLATLVRKHPSTLTGVFARLEERGLLSRAPDPDDRRVSRFALTPTGKRLNRDRRTTVEAAARRALSRVSETEVAGTVRVVDEIVAELRRARGTVKP